jgi:hypothetical protein
MSRSIRRTSISGMRTAPSEKQDKRLANRRLRRIVRCRLAWQFAEVLPELREISDRWSFKKDGKAYFDRVRYGRLMRK